ncbi:MAG: hypothetical protein FD170_1419 [Bacteroidetes bacterium]|nr:MAG: hypothetical protein FD170_1419 [Bacteroidota bacterium]
MRTNAKFLPPRLLDLGNGQYHFNHSVEVQADENGQPDYYYESVLVNGEPTYNLLVTSMIADRYSTAQELALINNFNADKEVQAYVDYQRYRELSKLIALSPALLLKAEVDALNVGITKIKITLPLAKVVAGGVYASLADLLMKKKAIFASTDTHVTVWVSYLLEQHQAILAADPEVTIET